MENTGYSALAPEQFTGFLHELTRGVWALTAEDDPRATPTLAFFKGVLSEAIVPVMLARRATRDTEATRACAAAFEWTHESLVRMIPRTHDRTQRATLEAMLDSIRGLLAHKPEQSLAPMALAS